MSNLVAGLADSFRSFGVARAYGDPVSIGDQTVIPVALVHYGFGGGGTDAAARPRTGSAESSGDGAPGDGASARGAAGVAVGGGGGGGGIVIPLGVYRKNASGLMVFRPNTLVIAMCLIPAVGVAGRVISAVLHARARR